MNAYIMKYLYDTPWWRACMLLPQTPWSRAWVRLQNDTMEPRLPWETERRGRPTDRPAL